MAPSSQNPPATSPWYPWRSHGGLALSLIMSDQNERKLQVMQLCLRWQNDGNPWHQRRKARKLVTVGHTDEPTLEQWYLLAGS